MKIEIKKLESLSRAKRWVAAISRVGGSGGIISFNVLKACLYVTRLKVAMKMIKYPLGFIRFLQAGGMKTAIYSAWKGDKIILIAPLFCNEKLKWEIIGFSNNLDYQDFIYSSDYDNKDIAEALEALFSRFHYDNISDVNIGQLPVTSLLRFLPEGFLSEIENSKSVCIDLGDRGYSGYFEQLGKHAKQNLRTAYNRCRRNGKSISFSFYSPIGIGEDINKAKGKKAIRLSRALYRQRQEKRYNHYRGILHRIALRYANYTSLSIPGENGFVASVWIGEKLAASMDGYINRTRRALEIPRLSINDNLAWYSPGLILLSETARFLLEKSDIRQIDLCRGTEKYKFDMGGREYVTSHVILKMRGKK